MEDEVIRLEETESKENIIRLEEIEDEFVETTSEMDQELSFGKEEGEEE